MATVTKFLKGAASAPLVHIGGHKIVAENLLDFSLDGFDVAGADVVQALIIPAGAVVTDVRFETLTAEGGAATATIGDVDTVAGWEAAADLNSADGIVLGGGAYATNGLRYASELTIDVIPTAALDACRLLVIAEYYINEQL